MATRLFSVVIAADDPAGLAAWWAAALDTPLELDGEVPYLRPEGAPRLEFVRAAAPKTGNNRIHLDLATYSAAEHESTVTRLVDAGATHVDVGQDPDADWVVLADPEGNELCVVEPRPTHGYDGPLAIITFNTPQLQAVVDVWVAASGWPLLLRQPELAVLRAPSGRGPYLGMVGGGVSKDGVNRLHLDVAPLAGVDQGREVERLLAVGTHRVDIGQGDVPWVVLADADGNELCVLPQGPA